MEFFEAFIAGFISTLVFHQGLFALLHKAGKAPKPAWDMTPVPPLNVPMVISLAFWGGVWGIALWLAIMHMGGIAFWLAAIVLGAIFPSIVALWVVFPAKGKAMPGGWDTRTVTGALMLNGAWGFGVAFIMCLLTRI